DIGDVHDWIGKDKDDCEIAILSAATTLDSCWPGRRQPDIESAGAAVSFSRHCAEKWNRGGAACVTHKRISSIAGNIVRNILRFWSGIGSCEKGPNINRAERSSHNIFSTAVIDCSQLEVCNSDADESACDIVAADG